MTMQVTSSMNSTYHQSMMHSGMPSPKSTTHSSLNEVLTPEQQNTAQKTVDDKMTEQVNNIKQNYQTAKDYDLMTSYYDQQQKLLDIYMQTSTEDSTTISSQNNESSSAVSTLTNAYSDLYQLHQTIKDGVSTLPSIDENPETLPTSHNQTLMPSITQNAEQGSNINSVLSNKQLDSYNSLMMPTTSNYVHLSA